MVRPDGGRSAAEPPSRVALTVALLLVVGVTADVLLRGPLSSADGPLMDWLKSALPVHSGRHPGERRGLLLLAELGSWTTVPVLVAPYLLLVCVRHRTIRPVARFAVLAVLVAPTVSAAKVVIGRTPPMADLLGTDGGRSFPSGHAAAAVLMWSVVAWIAADYSAARARRLTRVLRWLAPLLTCAGMLLLRYHWLTDLVAGAALAVVLLAVLHVVDRTALAHLPGAQRGIAGAGDADRRRVDAARSAAGVGGRPGPVHDPGPADR